MILLRNEVDLSSKLYNEVSKAHTKFNSCELSGKLMDREIFNNHIASILSEIV
jgi:hypothetical protein